MFLTDALGLKRASSPPLPGDSPVPPLPSPVRLACSSLLLHLDFASSCSLLVPDLLSTIFVNYSPKLCFWQKQV